MLIDYTFPDFPLLCDVPLSRMHLQLCPPGFGRANIVTGPHHIVWMGDLNYRVDWGQQVGVTAANILALYYSCVHHF
jgi:hypothetical protein